MAKFGDLKADKTVANKGGCHDLTQCGAGVEMERAKGFEPSTLFSQAPKLQPPKKVAIPAYTQIRAHVTEEGERLQVYRIWPRLPSRVKAAILAFLELVPDWESTDADP